MKKDEELDIYFYWIGWISVALCVAGVIFVKIKGFDILYMGLPCVVNATTGYYCPGCGGTRAVVALLEGHLLKSFFYHPIVLYILILGGWFLLSQTVERLSKGKIPIALHYRNIYAFVAIGIVVVNCLIKNLVLAIYGIALMG